MQSKLLAFKDQKVQLGEWAHEGNQAQVASQAPLEKLDRKVHPVQQGTQVCEEKMEFQEMLVLLDDQVQMPSTALAHQELHSCNDVTKLLHFVQHFSFILLLPVLCKSK
ncbi:unnamed protein product [Enterobius vermicularis]|uniref:Pericentrin-like n=1 Tax=Enterobius vermicularis TaxID=51028 RepID=A0A0N4VR35_ENTVE|nr:unnamed protein product [Enterobius vermicularis]